LRQIWVVLIGCLAIAGLLAGCGDSEDSADAAPSKAAFVKEMNATCKASREKAGDEILKAYNTAEIKGAASEAEGIQLEVQVFVPILIDNAKADAAKLESLGAPDGDEEQAEAMAKAYDDWIKKAKGTPFKVVVANDVYNEARELAGKYGLQECAISPFEEG
jgi:hypothetical protein